MVRNDERRRELADAGIRVLARDGARGLSHRAVDAAAAAPPGTASNYFRSRAALLGALVTRIGERLAPDPAVQAAFTGRAPDRELFRDYVRDIVARLGAERDVTLALLELRLDAARRPEVADVLGDWLRAGLEGDVAFNLAAGLPGGRAEIVLLHYAIDGLLLDRLTTSIDPGTSAEEAADLLVDRLLGSPR